MGAPNPRVTNVTRTTYGGSDQLNRHGRGQSLHPDREVHVVYVDGAVTTRRASRTTGPQTFERTFWLFDAARGDLVGWGNAP
jgi:hypothetical protein